MLITFFGPPSPLAEWGRLILHATARVIFGDVHLIKADNIEQLRDAWAQRGGKAVFLIAEQPHYEVANLFLEGHRSVIFLPDPAHATAELIKTHGLDVHNAIRTVYQTFASLHDLSLAECSLLICDSDYDKPVHEIILRAVQFLTGPQPDTLVDRILNEVGLATGVGPTLIEDIRRVSQTQWPPEPASIAGWASSLALVDQTSGPFRNILRGQPVTQLIWPPEMFVDGERQGSPLLRAHDLLGPARVLVHGPYLRIPRGRWVGTVSIEVMDNFSGAQIYADVYADGLLKAAKASLPTKGYFQFDLEFEITDPGLPVEIRLFLQQAAIEGTILMRGVSVRRIMDLPTANSQIRQRPLGHRPIKGIPESGNG